MAFPGMEDNENLGFEMENEVNVFELFAKSQASKEETTPVEIPDDEDAIPAITPTPVKSTKPKAETSKPQTKTEDDKEEGEDFSDLLKTMIQEKTVGAAKKDNNTDNDSDDEDVDDNPIKVLYTTYKEKGIINVPDDFEFTGTEESLDEAITLTVENRLADRVDEEIDAAFTKNPANAQIAKDLISFLGKGGSVADFIESRKHSSINADALDSDNETTRSNAAKQIITSYYQSIGWDETRIQKQLNRKSGDVLVEDARDIYPEYKKVQDKMKADLDNELSTKDQQSKQNIQQFNDALKKAITENTELFGFDLSSPKAKQKLQDYLFKPTVEINGKKVPQFQADRQQQSNKPDFLLAQAVTLMNGMKVKTVNERKEETKQVSKLEEKLRQLQQGKISTASGQGTDNKGKKNRQPSNIFDFDDNSVINL